jgi:serine/threonine protein kinase/tetratricopeptide (TPR) repeat protein
MALLPGTRLGPYEVLHTLGSGGMGEVYAARDVSLRRLAALKVLPDSLVADAGRLARFEREAQLASSLNHPNIVTIYTIGREGDVAYIAMELVDGQTLDAAVGPWSLDRVTAVAVQVASGLAKAHEAGVVHRDLKPPNVMVTKDGLVKLLDFGLSTTMPLGDIGEAATLTHAPLTKPGMILGTVHYMSPEQAAGRPVDFRSDQFSFGCLLYELLTGRQPFQGATAVQTLSMIIEASPRPIGEFNPDVPDPLQAIVARCLSKKPEDRYASTQNLAHDLEALRHQRMTPGSRTRSADRRPARRWIWIAAAVAAGAMFTPAIRTRLPWPLAPAPVRQQLAVLPFTNIGGDPGSRSFSDGLVEVVTGQLTQIARLSALDVVPASDIQSEGITSPRDARRVFRVTRAINGQIQRDGGSIRVTVNLIDTETPRQIDSRTIDMAGQGAIAMQDAIVREVALMLKAALPADVQQTWTDGGTTHPAAYEAYLQGRGHLQRYDQIESIDRAIAAFEQAVKLDEKYALAHAGLGEAYWRKYELTKDSRWVTSARQSCSTALGLADRLAPVHLTLGVISGGTGRYEEAVTELRRGIALDPISADAYRELANVYQKLGRTKETEETYKTAIDMRPNYWANYNALAAFYVSRARYREAEARFKRAIELAPDSTRAYNNLGGLYILTKRYAEAATVLEKSAAIKPTFIAYNNLGSVYSYLGRYGDAARQMEKAATFNSTDSRLLRGMASAYYWAPGEREKARPAYERALAAAEGERAVNPHSATLLIRMADCHAMLGHRDQARSLVAEALALAPDDVDVQFGAGVVYEEIGDRVNALAFVAKALSSGYSRDLVERSPELTALRNDSRFQRLKMP